MGVFVIELLELASLPRLCDEVLWVWPQAMERVVERSAALCVELSFLN